MATVAFKKGLKANLPQTYTTGTFYVTEDEKALYLDVSDSSRIRLSDFQVVADIAALNLIEDTNENTLYYVEDINCLAKYDGDKFVQINPDTGATKVTIEGEGNAITGASYDDKSRTLKLTKDDTFAKPAEIDEKITAKVGEVGEGTVKDYVDQKTESITADEGRIEALEEKVGDDPVSKQITDAITGLKLADTYAAKTHTHKIADVTGLQDELDKKATTEALTAVDGRVVKLETNDTKQDERLTTLEGKIEGVTGAMHYKGEADEDPASMSVFDDYKSGDVVTYGNKEYVFDGSKFVELGDVTEEAKRIGTLETSVADLDAKKHEHDNKEVLDGISAEKVGQWDAAATAVTWGAF